MIELIKADKCWRKPFSGKPRNASTQNRLTTWLVPPQSFAMPMQVARLYDFGDIRIEQSPRPEPGASDLLVRVTACGICSGDIMPWYIRRKAPLVLGHEPVGVIAEAGPAVRDFKPGDRVFVHHHAPCFNCAPCSRGEYVQCSTWRSSQITPGGMSEYFLVSPTNQRDTLKLPEDIDDLNAVLIEPAACVVKSLRRSGLRPGESVLIIGLGIMGMMHVKLARHLGAGTIIGADLFEQRALRAKQLGADHGIVVAGDNLPDQVREITNGAMVDVVVVGPGTTRALATGIACAGKAATVVQFTATPPEDELLLRPHDLYFNETRIVPSYSCGPDDTRESMELVGRGVLNARELITHRFPLTQISEAYEQAQRPDALKVVVTFG
ncbi:MAG TPA: alcohol dehydrogenase catalytic domain-containing protein [Candidatus Binataceae bacterium]|nr:alcohol dehydrogenase catalytic domain-containing protein [Candidatus Binataceae bacterium]